MLPEWTSETSCKRRSKVSCHPVPYQSDVAPWGSCSRVDEETAVRGKCPEVFLGEVKAWHGLGSTLLSRDSRGLGQAGAARAGS